MRSAIFSFTSARNSFGGIGFSSPFALRRAWSAMRRKLATLTPGIAVGYWNARKSPFRPRSSASHSEMSSPWKRTFPEVISYFGFPMSAFARVLFPEPFGPMIACTSPLFTVSVSPLRMGFPSTATWRSWI